ncbi:MAG: TIR domain-containing protein [Caulobacterales bacterium]
MPDAGQRYWAFLSYSHEDLRWAKWLHRALEGYAVPRRLVGRATPAGPAPRRLRPIFRDRDELGAGANLGERLVTALNASAYLIVICSPSAARSTWVEEEIRRFKSVHGEDRVLAVIVAGKPFASDLPEEADQECFPKSLRVWLDEDELIGERRVEPAAADLRPGKDGRRGALLKLLSGMLHIDLDEIVQRDAQRRHQQLLALTTASFVGTAAMGALALVAVNARNEAVAQRAQAEGLIEFMIGDLRKTLEPAGRLDALDAIGNRALGYYAAQQNHGLDATSLGRRARVLQVLGLVRQERGDLPGAMRFYEESSKSTAELLLRRPNDPQRIFDHAQAVGYIGEIAQERGDDGVALQEFREYLGLADRLVALDPRNRDWWAEVDEASTNVGVVLLQQGRNDEAAANFERALSISKDLARRAPGNRDRQWDLSQILAWTADAEASRGRLDAALDDRTAEGAIYARLLAKMPGDTASAVALAASRTAMAKIRMLTGATSDAIVDLRAASGEMDRLMAASPDNTVYRANATPTFLLLGQALLQTGQLDAAAGAAQRALDISEAEAHAAQARHDQGLAWRGARLGAARVLCIRIAAARSESQADQKSALQAAPPEAARLAALSRSHGRSASLARAAAEAELLAGDYASLDGKAAQARTWWATADGALRTAPPPLLTATADGGPLLQQLAYRLRFSHPPTGPLLPAGEFVTASSVRRGSPGTIDYRW